jgi:hypothetical protein
MNFRRGSVRFQKFLLIYECSGPRIAGIRNIILFPGEAPQPVPLTLPIPAKSAACKNLLARPGRGRSVGRRLVRWPPSRHRKLNSALRTSRARTPLATRTACFRTKIRARKSGGEGSAPVKMPLPAKAIYYWLECTDSTPRIPNFRFASRAFFIVDSGSRRVRIFPRARIFGLGVPRNKSHVS